LRLGGLLQWQGISPGLCGRTIMLDTLLQHLPLYQHDAAHDNCDVCQPFLKGMHSSILDVLSSPLPPAPHTFKRLQAGSFLEATNVVRPIPQQAISFFGFQKAPRHIRPENEGHATSFGECCLCKKARASGEHPVKWTGTTCDRDDGPCKDSEGMKEKGSSEANEAADAKDKDRYKECIAKMCKDGNEWCRKDDQ